MIVMSTRFILVCFLVFSPAMPDMLCAIVDMSRSDTLACNIHYQILNLEFFHAPIAHHHCYIQLPLHACLSPRDRFRYTYQQDCS